MPLWELTTEKLCTRFKKNVLPLGSKIAVRLFFKETGEKLVGGVGTQY